MKLGGMANVLCKVCVLVDAERFHILKRVQFGKDVVSEIVCQVIGIDLAEQDTISIPNFSRKIPDFSPNPKP